MSFEGGYRELPAPPALAGVVACFWMRRPEGGADAAHSARPVLPDNCADWILDLSPAPVLRSTDGEPVRALAVGVMSRPLVAPTRADTTLLGVRFRPGRWAPLFGVEAVELRDARVALELLRPKVADRLLDRVRTAGDDRSRVDALASELAVATAEAAGDRELLAEAAIARIEARRGAVGIARLAVELGCSRQHLAAVFRRTVGLSPKTFAAVTRFRAALRPGGRWRWTDVAMELGYADHSHMLRDFRRFAGGPPTSLIGDGAGTAPGFHSS